VTPVDAGVELRFPVGLDRDHSAAATREDPRELVVGLRRRVRRATAIASAAGAVDTLFAIGFVIPGFFSSKLSNQSGFVNGPLVAIVVAAGLIARNRFGDSRFEVVRRWLLAGCPADEAAASVALRLPLMSAGISATLWLVGAAVFGIFDSVLVSPARGARRVADLLRRPYHVRPDLPVG
jgi:hypothetical protein